MNREPYGWECERDRAELRQQVAAFSGVWLFAIVLACLYTACGCIPAKSVEAPARASARAAVITLATGLQATMDLCDVVAVRDHDVRLARKCLAAYDIGKPSLYAAEAGLDAWEKGQEGQVACSVAQAVVALEQLRGALNAAGETVPSAVDDALAVGGAIGGACGP